MKRFARILQAWLRWRAAQGRSHWFGLAEHTMLGTIVACEYDQWKVEDDQGRFVFVPVQQFAAAPNLQVGDCVEVQPLVQGGPVSRPYGWTVVRKVEN